MDYDSYFMSKKEYILILLFFALLFFLLGYICYRKRLIFLVFFTLSALKMPKKVKKYRIKNQKKRILEQFKMSLFALSSSLEVGKSLENSIEEVIKDLRIQYSNHERIIIEYEYILKKIRYNQDVYKAFNNFAKRTGNKDIINFAEIFKLTKETGGDLNKIIYRTSRLISEKIEIEKEIQIMIEAKKNELFLINCMPFILIIILSIFSKEYIDPVFETWIGNIGMTISLFLILISKKIANKIISVEV